LVIVHGGAGSGKSRVIKPLAEWIEHTLRQPGDDPNNPYVVLCSFTGAAAANINRQTLHSFFGFKFGIKFLSMSDKQRDEKRCLFRNLKCVIVDEIFLVSADLFYNLDLKLREIMLVDKPMVGLSVFLFGDLFQLRPPKARYVFEEAKNREHSLVYRLRNLWETFKLVNLEENHRQGEDKNYADLLNRVRVGEFTDEDIETLSSRVRGQNDIEIKENSNALHIYGTNAKVIARNKEKN
jgi:ATP-dependent DNA helicase PIF1